VPLNDFLDKFEGVEGRFGTMSVIEQFANLRRHVWMNVAQLERMKQTRWLLSRIQGCDDR
jgi:hypothetical protein